MMDEVENGRDSAIELRASENPLQQHWRSFNSVDYKSDNSTSLKIPSGASKNESSTGLDWTWGINSEEPEVKAKARKRAKWCCCACTVLNCALWWPLVLLVFIPMYIQSAVNDGKVSVVQANLIDPTSAGFASKVELKFANTGSTSVKIKSKSLKIYLHEEGQPGVEMAKLGSSNTVTIGGSDSSPVTLKASAVVTNATAMSEFTTSAISAKSLEWHLKGTAEVTIPSFTSTEVQLNKIVSLDGFNNFSIGPHINSVNTTKGTSEYLYNNMSTRITSQASMAVDFGQDLFYQIHYNDTQIGIGVIPDASFQTGNFTVLGEIQLFSEITGTPEEYFAVMSVQSNYISGITSPLKLSNFYLAQNTSISWMVNSLNSINMDASLAPLTTTLLQQEFLQVDLLNPLETPFQMLLSNTLDVTLYIDTIQGHASYKNTEISTIDIRNAGIVIPPHTTIKTSTYHSKSYDSQVSLIEELVNDPDAVLNITILEQTGFIDEYPIALGVQFLNVPANVTCTPYELCYGTAIDDFYPAAATADDDNDNRLI